MTTVPDASGCRTSPKALRHSPEHEHDCDPADEGQQCHNDVGGPYGRKRPQVRRSVDPTGRKDRGEDAPDNKCLEALKAFAETLKQSYDSLLMAQ